MKTLAELQRQIEWQDLVAEKMRKKSDELIGKDNGEALKAQQEQFIAEAICSALTNVVEKVKEMQLLADHFAGKLNFN